MPPELILALDQGTTNTKALLVTASGDILARASRPMTLSHPKPGWAEQSAEAIWDTVAQVLNELVADASSATISALAISNQRETIILWDAVTGQAIAPAISWQCRRTADYCAALKAAGHQELLVSRTGLGIDPLFPSSKLAWLLDEIPGARDRAEAGELRAGTVDSWIIWNLTAGASHATDLGNASRTQLLDLHKLQWDPALADLFQLPLSLLPALKPSNACFGVVAAQSLRALAAVPIRAVMGDSHAALFGHGIMNPGAAKVTIGTGSSIMSLTDRPARSHNGLSTAIAWSQASTVAYAIEGNITVSGQAAAFATTLLGLKNEIALSALAQTVSDTGGVVFVPALAGLGAPHWRPDARGMMTGITHSTTPAHIARATYEAIAMQIVDVCDAMEADIGSRLPEISVDGGATRDDFLLQLLADLLDRPVRRTDHPELSALGVARMAADSLGSSSGRTDAAQSMLFLPGMAPDLRDKIRSQWVRAIRQTVSG